MVRPPAYRGTSGPPELRTATPAGERWAMPPGRAERRNRLARRTDVGRGRPERGPTRAGSNWEPARHRQRRTGTGSPSKCPSEDIAGLTNPSSATGTGDARLDNEKERNAGACSLERVVRPWRQRCGRMRANVLHTGMHGINASLFVPTILDLENHFARCLKVSALSH